MTQGRCQAALTDHHERKVGNADVGLEVNLQAAAQELGMDHHSPYLAALVDSMEVAGWI